MNAEQLSHVAHVLNTEAVSSARAIAIVGDAVECSAGDGSRWYILTDRYAVTYGWGATIEAARADYERRRAPEIRP